jgi:hypothetical protein
VIEQPWSVATGRIEIQFCPQGAVLDFDTRALRATQSANCAFLLNCHAPVSFPVLAFGGHLLYNQTEHMFSSLWSN